MNFLQKLLQGIAFVPTIVNSIEGLFGGHTGEQKKESAISFVAAALQLTESVANREIVDWWWCCRRTRVRWVRLLTT